MGLSHKYHVGPPVPLPKGHPPHLILQDLHAIRRQRCLQTVKWCADEDKGPCLPCSSVVKAPGGQFAVSSVVCKQVHNMCTCVCARVCVGAHTHDTEYMWRSEDNLPESVLSCYHVGLRD